jgi:hypothetical protein
MRHLYLHFLYQIVALTENFKHLLKVQRIYESSRFVNAFKGQISRTKTLTL